MGCSTSSLLRGFPFEFYSHLYKGRKSSNTGSEKEKRGDEGPGRVRRETTDVDGGYTDVTGPIWRWGLDRELRSGYIGTRRDVSTECRGS